MQNYDKMQRILIMLVIVNITVSLPKIIFTYAQENPKINKDLHQKTLYHLYEHEQPTLLHFLSTFGRPSGIPQIIVSSGPSAIGIDTSTNKIYVANSADNTVSVIDGNNNTKIGRDIPVGNRPIAIGVGIESHPTYVANSIKYSSATGVDYITRTVYVANSADNTVSVIDGNNNTKIGRDIPVGASPSAIGIDTSTNKIYVANSADNTVSVIDGNNNT
ncbi:MAG: YncE family protein, partial [Nitrososphaeraceae archaeon]